jgi:hypothetical protein
MINSIIYRYISVLIFVILIVSAVYGVIDYCGGNYIYPLDDTYIHLSVANNLANHGVWGVTQHEFSSSSSSILYTLILSISIFIFGNNQLLPLILNVLFSYFIIFYLFKIFKPLIFIEFDDIKRRILSGIILSIAIILIILFAPLVILTLSGMEHTLQILINIIFIQFLITYLENFDKRNFIKLFLISMAVTTVRYEGLFLILIAMIFFANKKDYKKGLILLFISIIPLIIFGLISVMNSWMPLPNSILLKSTKPENFNSLGLLKYPFGWIMKLFKEPHLLTIFITSCSILWVNYKSRFTFKDSKNIWLILTVLLTILHLTFAKTGWVFRYEAYIVVIGLIGVLFNLTEIVKFGEIHLKRAVLILSLIMVYACGERAYESFRDARTMSVNIYEQQYQMSRFIKEYYNNSAVVLGDIGCCTYFTNIKLIDLVALGSIEPLKLRMNKKFNVDEVRKLADNKNVEIAILYKEPFQNLIPKNWTEIGTWKIKNNIGCYMDKVTFYSVKPEKSVILLYNLSQFSKKLPVGVEIINN